MIRDATEMDLEQLLDLAEAKRKQYADFPPRFHRPAPDAREKLAVASEWLVGET